MKYLVLHHTRQLMQHILPYISSHNINAKSFYNVVQNMCVVFDKKFVIFEAPSSSFILKVGSFVECFDFIKFPKIYVIDHLVTKMSPNF